MDVAQTENLGGHVPPVLPSQFLRLYSVYNKKCDWFTQHYMVWFIHELYGMVSAFKQCSQVLYSLVLPQ